MDLAVFDHWEWIPMVACFVIFFLWLTGCTLAPNGASSSPQPTPPPTFAPPMTITVFESLPDTPSPTIEVVAQVTLQPTSQIESIPRQHTVRENDTLLDIAIQYDISLDALVNANPDIDPRILQIGQELIIPDAENLLPVEINPAPVPLSVMPPECYSTSTDSLLCMGYVLNDQSQAVEQISLNIDVNDATEQTLDSQTAIVEQSYIMPGAIAPYRALFAAVDEDAVRNVVVTLQSALATDTIEQRFASLILENEVLTRNGRRYTYSADLINAGQRTSEAPRLTLTLRDQDDNVVGYRIWQGSAPLFSEIRTRVEFSILPVAAAAQAESLTYYVHAEARLLN